jgi:hypothetical protein
METMLKDHIYNELRKQPLVTIVANAANVSPQSIRLWAKKRDIRLLAYPIMEKLAEYYSVNYITDLLKT